MKAIKQENNSRDKGDYLISLSSKCYIQISRVYGHNLSNASMACHMVVVPSKIEIHKTKKFK